MVRNYKRKTEDRWSKEDLLNALKSIQGGKVKINDAARQTGISRATLYRHYQKFVVTGPTNYEFRTCGGNPILSHMEEDVLEKTVINLRANGFKVTSGDVKRICFEYCYSNGIPNQFNVEKRMASDDWYYGFLKRHPAMRVPSTNKSTSSDGSAVAEGLVSSEDSSEVKEDELTPPVIKVEMEEKEKNPDKKRKNVKRGKRQVKKKAEAEATKTMTEVRKSFDMPLLEPEVINGDEGMMSKMQE